MWWDERLTTCKITPPRLTLVLQLECPFTRNLIFQCFSRRPQWQVQVLNLDEPCPKDCTLHWSEYEVVDWTKVFKGGVYCSCYCIRKGLIRKGHFAYNIKKWIAKRPKCELQFHVPETHLLSVHDPEYFEEALYDVPEIREMHDGELWIAKPSITNQGNEVFLFDRIQGLQVGINRAPELQEWVVQRYIHPPLLLMRRKFHIRVYVLCVGNLEVFVWNEMLVLLASKDYDLGLENLKEIRSHLTNTCLGSKEQNLDFEDPVFLISELPKMLINEGLDLCFVTQKVDLIKKQIHQILTECFEAISHEMSFLALPNCFEFFGFDFLIDQEWTVWILEANAEPDFKQTGERLKFKLEQMFEESLQILIDPISKFHPFGQSSENQDLKAPNKVPASWTGIYKR